MFASIKGALNKPQEKTYKDILKFEAGKTYIVRLLPNLKAPEQTFFHYFHYSWKSFATGQFVSFISPQTFGERCPIGEDSYKIYKNGSPEEKEKGKALFRKENYLVNVYVVSDPTNPENEGKVKIMRYGNQLHKIIRSAIDGDDSAEFGEKIFDLSEKGCNFRIKCEKKSDKAKNAEFVEYTSSRFLSPSKIEGLDDPQKIQQVYNSVHDLTAMFTVKSYDELKEALNEHYYCKTTEKPVAKKQETKRISTDEAPNDDDIPMEYKQEKKKAPVEEKVPEPKVEEKKVETKTETKKPEVADAAIKSLLDGLDDL